MNEKLPKPMIEGLARQAESTVHPSADVLAAYMEQSLLETERDSVTGHLAQCRDCRQVVFLASGAAEELVLSKPMAAGPARQQRWLPRLVWVGTVAAGLLVGGYFVRDRLASQRRETLVASNQEMQAVARPALPQTQSQEAAPPQAVSNAELAAPRPGAPIHEGTPSKNAMPAATVASARPPQAAKAPELRADVAAPAPSSNGNAVVAQDESAHVASTTIEVGDAAPTFKALTPQSNSFAASATPEVAPGEGSALGGTAARSMSLAKPVASANWRVNGAGCVEHQTPDGWTRALADQPAVFRSVTARGDEVWAGGDGGALFHSSDGGMQWKKVVLSAESGPETATVVTIRFSSPQHGVVITSAGTVYATLDGGATWTKR